MSKEEKRMCIKCGKYEAEECFTFCEFCLGVSNKDDYIKDLQRENTQLKREK